MLRELGYLAHVFCWFHDVCMRVCSVHQVHAVLTEVSLVLFGTSQTSPGLTLPFGDGRSPIHQSFVKYATIFLLIHYGRVFTLYRIDSVRLTSRCSWTPTPTFWTVGHNFNNSWILSTSGNRCGFQVPQLGGSILACFVSLTDCNINTWLSFVLF